MRFVLQELPNPYATDSITDSGSGADDNENPSRQAKERIRAVEVQILDVIFDGQMCSLVYLRDITKLIRQQKQALAE